MQKIQIKAEIDILDVLGSLDIQELEKVMHEASSMLVRRKTADAQHREAELMTRLQDECRFPDGYWATYRSLTEKRHSGLLSEQENQNLLDLIQEEEQLRLRRIQILGELAQLKGISIQQLALSLGLNSKINA